MEQKSSTNTSKLSSAGILVTLGIIYGDIGTSPLYVLKAIIGEKPIEEKLVLGAISCIVWTLFLQTSIKYIWLTLKADNAGEGGIFSLYALVRRRAKWLAIPTILGATALLADGIITPPISVASAIEGLETANLPFTIPVVPIVVVILSLLFFFQRFGTHQIGRAFGPAMLLWFAMLLFLGLYHLVPNPEVLKAINPAYAFDLLRNYPNGFWLLGGVFLATTGAEALYSDMGHCGKQNIRASWIFVKTCLLTNYFGQAAWLLNQSASTLQGKNPFYQLMPEWFLLIGIAIATVATIIASQALITGSYTLVNEAMNLNFWPRVAVRQPSESKGQVYIPSVNSILWIGCVLMILYFRSSAHMEAAYGFSITVAMMMTSLLLFYFLLYRLNWNKISVTLIFIGFACVELSFFIANTAKIKERWMFLFFELFIFLTMYTWYYARKVNNKKMRFVELGQYASALNTLHKNESIPKHTSHLIYLTKANQKAQIEEKILLSIFSKKPKRAELYWFFHLNRTEEPYTLTYAISEIIKGVAIRIDLNIGFRVPAKTELYFKSILQDLAASKEVILPESNTSPNPFSNEPDFKFVVIEKYLSVENNFSLRESLLLNSYFFLKKVGQDDSKAFGLERADVITEWTPIVYQPAEPFSLKRIS